ncbi:MAG: glycosyltransferase family 9 protein [Thermodesulfobacteriota bacterium]
MEFKKVCVIHLNQIGDLLFSLPVLKALKESAPSAIVHSVIRPHLKDLLSDSPFVDQVLLRERGVKSVGALLRKLRTNIYDVLITLSRSEECFFLATFSGARIKAGFACFPWDLGLDVKERMMGPPSLMSNLSLLKRLNIEAEKKDYVGLVRIPFDKNLGGSRGKTFPKTSGEYAVISPGTSARRRIKTWAENKFADLILQLIEKYDFGALLVGGGDSSDVSESIVKRVRERAKERKLDRIENLAGKTNLKELCYLLKEASLFIGVDSGIMHLASSFDIPVVGIFGPTDPFYLGPQNSRSRVVREEMECSPCNLKGCEERLCMKNLSVQKVLDACEDVLRL